MGQGQDEGVGEDVRCALSITLGQVADELACLKSLGQVAELHSRVAAAAGARDRVGARLWVSGGGQRS